jgi:phage-related protein (TIGR01555 family)
MKLLDKIVGAFRRDGYENTLSGLAGTRNNANKFVAGAKLSEADLKSLYDFNWLGRRITDAIVDQALRKPFIGDQAAFDPFNKVNNDPRFPGGALRHGLKLGRLFGGAVIVQGIVGSGAPLEQPLPVAADGTVKAGEIAFLDVLSRFDLDSAEKYDLPDDPTKHKRTSVWKVKTGRLKDLKIHETRLIFCPGLAKVTLTDEQEDRDWPWISCLQPINEILGNYGITWTAISHLIQESSVAWLRLRGLTDMLTSEDKSAVDERMNLLSTGRHVAKTVFLEAGDDAGGSEEYGRTDVSFTGLPDLVRECTLMVCGAARTPYIILMGDTPSGLNATGNATMQQWYDTAEEYRREVEPIVRLLFSGTKVTVDWKWPPLWEPTAAEAADIRLKQLQGDQVLFTMAVIEPDNVLESRGKDGTLGLAVDWEAILATHKKAKEGPTVELTPTANAAALTMNEIRANQGKGVLFLPGTTTPDPDGDLPSEIFTFKKTEEIKAQLVASTNAQNGAQPPGAQGTSSQGGGSPTPAGATQPNGGNLPAGGAPGGGSNPAGPGTVDPAKRPPG